MFLLRPVLSIRRVLIVFVLCALVLCFYDISSGDDSVLQSYLNSSYCENLRYDSREDFDGFDNNTGAPYNCTIVPNYVHFVKFKQKTFNFPHTVCMLAALKNQNPDKIFIHTDVSGFHGKYWDVMLAAPGFKEKLVINYVPMPTEIFGQPLNKYWLPLHGGDVTRLQVLMKYGGIYLDNDACIINNLDYFRRFEMALGWKPGKVLGNMVIVAHKNARFLYKWLQSYKNNYYPKRFFYNAGVYPAFSILKKQKHLVHRVEKLFGNYGPFKPLYLLPFPEWRDYYAIHTLSSHLFELRNKSPNLKYPVKLSENNIMSYPVAYRDLVLSVFPHELIKNYNSTL